MSYTLRQLKQKFIKINWVTERFMANASYDYDVEIIGLHHRHIWDGWMIAYPGNDTLIQMNRFEASICMHTCVQTLNKLSMLRLNVSK